jgi:hypothetical protein
MPIRLGISASVGVAALTLLTASRAVAHIDLLEPEARAHGTAARDDTDIDENSNLKQAPCGQIVTGRSARVATYAAGETIRVRVREENAHVSYLRVSIDLDGEDFPLRQPAARDPETQEEAAAAEAALGGDGLLAVYREDNDTPGFVHELEVTLPQAACTSCTLQVLQYMYDDPAAPYYFQCADLVIVGADGAEDAGAVGSDDGPAPSPSAANGGAPSLGAASPVTDPIATGSVATGDSASPAGATPAATGATPAANGGPNVVTPSPSAAGPAAGSDSTGCSLSHVARRPPFHTGFALLTLGFACLRRRLRRRISLRRA